MFSPKFNIAKSVLHRSRHFKLPGRAEVGYARVRQVMDLGNSLISRLHTATDVRLLKQLIRKAQKHLIDMYNVKTESWVEENDELNKSFSKILAELSRVIRHIRGRMT